MGIGLEPMILLPTPTFGKRANLMPRSELENHKTYILIDLSVIIANLGEIYFLGFNYFIPK